MNIYLDFETFPIEPGNQSPKPISLAVCFDETDGATLYKGELARYVGTNIVKDNRHVLVASNAPFELEVLSKHWGLRSWVRRMRAEGRVRCTETQERLLRIRTGQSLFRVGLAALVKKYFEQDISASKGADSVRTRYHLIASVPLVPHRPEGPCTLKDFEDAPTLEECFDMQKNPWEPKTDLLQWPKEFALYALEDAEWTRGVFQAQEAVFSKITGLPLGTPITDIGPQVNAKTSLYRMRSLGVFSERTRVEETIQELQYHRAKLWKVVEESGIGRDDGTKDMKKLRARIEDALGAEIENFKTEKGHTRTDRSTIALAATFTHRTEGPGYIRVDDQTVDVVLEALSVINTLDKFLSAYLQPLCVPDGQPIHWQYTELVNTGRTSASSSWQSHFVDSLDIQMRSGTNFQNFPTPRSLQNLAKRIARVESFL